MEAAQSSGVFERASGLRYSRHSPESTLLYQIVERHYPRLLETLGDCARSLPRHVQREFEDYLECGLGADIGARLARRSACRSLSPIATASIAFNWVIVIAHESVASKIRLRSARISARPTSRCPRSGISRRAFRANNATAAAMSRRANASAYARILERLACLESCSPVVRAVPTTLGRIMRCGLWDANGPFSGHVGPAPWT